MAPNKDINTQQNLSQTISEVNKSLSLITDLVQLRDNFTARIKEIAQVDFVSIFLMDPDHNRYYPIRDELNLDNEPGTYYFTPGDKLVFWLNVNKRILSLSENPEVLSFLSEREQGVLQEMDAEIIFPFVIMNQIRGFVIMGKKKSDSFTSSELDILSMLFEQASFAFENSLLYMQQRERSGKMFRADRLATLGELAAGTAHEIRNPLTTIRSTIQYLRNRIESSDDKALVDDLIGEVDRINDIIQDMLSFAKLEELKTEEIDLNHLISQTLRLVENSARSKGIEILLDYDTELRTIQVDSSLMKQALLNILMNAIQALNEPGGRIAISIRNRKSEADYKHSGIFFLLEFRDNGPGIPRNLIEKVFDPFYTTKQEGTGLGLSITYSIINRHRGDIVIQSEENKGTVVKIKIPARQTK